MISKKTVSSLLPLLFVFVLFISACASYNQQILPYYTSMNSGNYPEALKALESNKLLQKNRNLLLYYLERGRTEHALSNYDSSNVYFNRADALIEEYKTSVGDVVSGTLVNPMMQRYKAEDFEKIMIHYYKALNYLYLGNTEDAVVEARRITLQNQQLDDKFKGKTNRYSRDAFAQVLQGLIYESNGDINNAFIAYRNAAERFLDKSDTLYYGIKIPEQLKKDVLRTASANGFTDQLDRFERLFSMKYADSSGAKHGELVIFWEQGMAPVKSQQDIFFTLTKGTSSYYFLDPFGNNIPLQSGIAFNANNFKAADMNNFRVAFPVYKPAPFKSSSAEVELNGRNYALEKAEDINVLAKATLRQRYVAEVSVALSRLVVKKAAQMAIKGNSDDKKNRDLRDGLAMAMDLYSLFSEKADTRNWQTLPSAIYYSRIPLKEGKNEIKLNVQSDAGTVTVKTMELEGDGRMHFLNFASMR